MLKTMNIVLKSYTNKIQKPEKRNHKEVEFV